MPVYPRAGHPGTWRVVTWVSGRSRETTTKSLEEAERLDAEANAARAASREAPQASRSLWIGGLPCR